MRLTEYIEFAQAYQKLTNSQKQAVSRFVKFGAEKITEYEVALATQALESLEDIFRGEDFTEILFEAHLELEDV